MPYLIENFLAAMCPNCHALMEHWPPRMSTMVVTENTVNEHSSPYAAVTCPNCRRSGRIMFGGIKLQMDSRS